VHGAASQWFVKPLVVILGNQLVDDELERASGMEKK